MSKVRLTPFSMAGGGRYSGYEVEFLQAVAADLGLKLSFQRLFQKS